MIPSSVIQLNKENTAISNENIAKGFVHEDAIHYDDWKHDSYKALANTIVQRYPNAQSILELGCGAGSLANHLRTLNNNLFVVTIDGNSETMNSPFIKKEHHIVCRTDREFNLVGDYGVYKNPLKFDLIISFEHFEHIENEYVQILLNNMERHSKINETLCIATAANWGENAHCNVKSKEQWIQTLEAYNNNGVIIRTFQSTVVTPNNKPFNFELHNTSELQFKFIKL